MLPFKAVEALATKAENLNETLHTLVLEIGKIKEEITNINNPSGLRALAPFAGLLSVLVAAGSVAFWFYQARNVTSLTHYTYLANKWYEIKEKEFANPDLVEIACTTDYKSSFKGNDLGRYNIFAWMCWGHAEDTFLNGWHNDPGFNPTIRWYKKNHLTWLLDEENKGKFDEAFIKYVLSL